jgi:TRAP-type C4-dicarboxylate transport system permease small subunit
MRQKINYYLGRFLALLMAIMTVDVLWGVFTRYAMGSQASWSEELARFLLIWIGILGAAYASGQNMHLAIDLLSPKLEGDSKRWLNIIIKTLIILFAFCVLIIGGFRLLYISQVLGQLSPALRIPMWIVYAVVPISGILIIYYKLTEHPSNIQTSSNN